MDMRNYKTISKSAVYCDSSKEIQAPLQSLTDADDQKQHQSKVCHRSNNGDNSNNI